MPESARQCQKRQRISENSQSESEAITLIHFYQNWLIEILWSPSRHTWGCPLPSSSTPLLRTPLFCTAMCIVHMKLTALRFNPWQHNELEKTAMHYKNVIFSRALVCTMYNSTIAHCTDLLATRLWCCSPLRAAVDWHLPVCPQHCAVQCPHWPHWPDTNTNPIRKHIPAQIQL